MTTEPLLVKVNAAASMLAVSRRTFYQLLKSDADIRAAIVELPGVQGKRFRVDLLRQAVERLSPTPAESKL